MLPPRFKRTSLYAPQQVQSNLTPVTGQTVPLLLKIQRESSRVMGKTDKADAAAILRYTGRLMNFDERQREIGDVNNDGNVDTADAVAILRGLS